MGVADGRRMEALTGQVSITGDLLATAEAVEEQDVWLDAWRTLLGALDGEGLLKWEETFLDGSFAPAKRGLCSR